MMRTLLICLTSGQGHDTASIPTMAARMRHELHIKLKVIADKITDGINLEKKTWEGLHQVESEVPKLMTEIDRVLEEKVSLGIQTCKHVPLCCL